MCASFNDSYDKSESSQRYRLARESQDVFRKSIEALMGGNLTLVKELEGDFLRKNPQYSVKDYYLGFHSEGRTLFHIAVSSGNDSTVDYILSVCELRNPRDVDQRDERGFTPLINATIAESSPIMQRLVRIGADVNARNNDGASAIHFAAGDGSVERMRLLLQAGADLTACSKLSGSPLHCAAGKGRADAVRFLLQQGVDVNTDGRPGAAAEAPNVAPPVLMAAAAASEEAVVLLVEAGADVGTVVQGGLTLLHICAEHGLLEAVKAVVKTETGRKCCDLLTDEGNSPLFLAAMSEHRAVVEALLPLTQCSLPDVDAVLSEGKLRMEKWQAEHSSGNSRSSSGSSAMPAAATNAAAASTAAAASGAGAGASAAVTDADRVEAERCKQKGNEFFTQKLYAQAVLQYDAAIRLDPTNAAYFSNRSAAQLAVGRLEEALRDAEACRRLRPDWTKGCYRLAAARLALKQYEDAAVAAFEGVKLDNQNKELKELLQECVKQGQIEHRRSQQQQQQQQQQQS